MPLVERLCQIDPDEPDGEPYDRHMALNPFCEALFSILGGYHTIAELKTFYATTAQDDTELDTLIARITAHPVTDGARSLAVHRVRSILTFWEMSGGTEPANPEHIPGYSTVEEIRTKFGEV